MTGQRARSLRARPHLIELQLIESRVDPSTPDQLVVRASLAQLALVQHEDLLCMPGGGQPVRDDKRRAPWSGLSITGDCVFHGNVIPDLPGPVIFLGLQDLVVPL